MKDVSGERFGHYHIIEQIDHIDEGDLYKAYDTNPPEKAVSLLLIGEALASRPGFQDRFQQAMARTQKLNDPSLLRVFSYGVWPQDATPYVVTEDPNGFTLREILDSLYDQQLTLKLTDALEIVREVCTAIEVVRLNHLPPRDLSQDNILDNIVVTWAEPSSIQQGERTIPSTLRILVTDLGLARMVDGHTADTTSADIYSLGFLLYRLIVGESEMGGQLDYTQIKPLRVKNPALPLSVDRIVRTATAFSNKQRERYDSPGLMAIDLTNAHWDAVQYDMNAPHRDRTIDLSFWLLQKRAEMDGVEYAREGDELLLPSVLPSGLADISRRYREVRLEALQPIVEIAPGGQAEIVLRLENVSPRDRHCYIRIDSKPGHIAINAIPSSVKLGPEESIDDEKESRLMIRPSGNPLCPAGTYRVRIAVIYNQNNIWVDSDVTEVITVVTRLQNCTIDVWPRTLEAGQPGQVTVSNRGNASESLLLSWTESKGKLFFDVEDVATDRASIILGPGDIGRVAFRPKLRRAHWWGKEQTYPFKIEIITPNQNALEAAECQAVSRRRIPFWLILAPIFGSLLLAFFILVTFRPQVVGAGECIGEFTVSQPSVAICVEPYNTVQSLTVFPGEVPLNVDEGQLILPAPLPDEELNTIRVIGHNRISQILPFLAYQNEFSLRVRQPPQLQPKLIQFCVGDADQPTVLPSCSTAGNHETLELLRGQAQTLLFSWQTENTTGEQVELLPQTIPFEAGNSSATAPAPPSSVTYSLNLVDAMGVRVEPLSVTVSVREIRDSVLEPVLYLRNDPGTVYEAIGLLEQGKEVILLTQPIDYQQNEDDLHWVQIIVVDTNETGWVAYEGLQGGADIAGTVGTVGAVGTFVTAGAPMMVDAATANANSGETVERGVGGRLPSRENDTSKALANLPVVVPEFGPTVTPTPTPTPTQTPTPLPTATPEPTKEPLDVSVNLIPEEIQPKGCVIAEWNIVGVEEVYFDYGRGVFEPIYDNRLRTATLYHHVDFGDKKEQEESILFRWRVVLPGGEERIFAKTLMVKLDAEADKNAACKN